MVYKFKFVSDEVVNFAREIEIDSENTFLQLRNAILDSVGYSKDDIDSFLICDDDWEGHEEITLEDMGSASDTDIWLMEDTVLSELIEEEGQKLRFIFDYLTDRSFFMELTEIFPSKHLSEPFCTFKKGQAPQQSVSLEEFEKKIDKITAVQDDMDADFYGNDEFNPEELGEGFDDLSIN